jgi:hypothetical protein
MFVSSMVSELVFMSTKMNVKLNVADIIGYESHKTSIKIWNFQTCFYTDRVQSERYWLAIKQPNLQCN